MTAGERLTAALLDLAERDQHTPCMGRRSARWTSDKSDDLTWAAFHCIAMGCPLLQACGAAADERDERHHVWGGVDRGAARARDRGPR
ncbi:MAG: hypothetical protein ACXVXP_06245 [Mycobacteriaceae bacterium]